MTVNNISIRELKGDEIVSALDLVWKVFQEYEAPDYTEEGVREFYNSIHDNSYVSQLTLYGAFLDEKLIGVIATRSEGAHIALFFVEGRYHRQGIGTRLFRTALEKAPGDTMTVNSSPFALEIYHRLGFTETDTEQAVNGLRFTPMIRKKKEAQT